MIKCERREEPQMEIAKAVIDSNVMPEPSSEFTVLKPVTYDIHEQTKTKLDTLNEINVDDHCDNFTKENGLLEKTNKIQSCEEIKNETLCNNEFCESEKKFSNFNCLPSPQIKKPTDVSSGTTPGKSRYGRIRRPKLSTDFVSVDRKSFAVLNSSSYEHVYADENTHTISPQPKKKLSFAKNNVSFVRDTLSTVTSTGDVIKQPLHANKIEDNVNDERLAAPMFSKTEIPLNIISDNSNFDDRSINSVNSSTIKTYSRKNEVSLCSTSSEDKQGIVKENKDFSGSQINYVELNWKVGDVAWAKIGCYPYWPSIVTLEYGSSIYVKPVGKRGTRLAIHVQFFGDRGRRSWVLTTSLIKYESREQFMELKRQYSKDKLKFKYFLIPRMRDLWEKGITEADTILKLPHDERIQYYQNIYPVSEETYAAELANINKIKHIPVRKRRNPEERRGRKKKILMNENKIKMKSLLTKLKAYDENEISKPVIVNNEDLGNNKSPKKLRKPIDEHTKERRAFMRRMNKILKQSKNISGFPIRKRFKNKMNLQRLKNNKFNKLLDKEKQKQINNKSSNINNQKVKLDLTENQKNALSVYDFDSDEETDVFIGTYNSRFNPQILAKIANDDENTTEVKTLPYSNGNSKTVSGIAMKHKTSDHNFRIYNKRKRNETDAEIKVETSDSMLGSKKYLSRRGRKPNPAKKVEYLNSLQVRKRGRPRKLPLIEKQSSISENINEIRIISNDNSGEEKKQTDCLFTGIKENFNEKMKKRSEKYGKNDKTNCDSSIFVEQKEPEEFQNEKQLVKTSELNEIQKTNKRSLTVSHEDELDSDDYESKSILNDIEEDLKLEEKRRSSSPQILPSTRLKKSSNIFAGLKFEKVCLICEKTGDTVRCRGPCSGTFHVECVQKSIMASESPADATVISKSRGRGRRPRKTISYLIDNKECSQNIGNKIEAENSNIICSSVEKISSSATNKEIQSLKVEECIKSEKDVMCNDTRKDNVKKCPSELLQTSDYLEIQNGMSLSEKKSENQMKINSACGKNDTKTVKNEVSENINTNLILENTDKSDNKICDIKKENILLKTSGLSIVDNCNENMVKKNFTSTQNNENEKNLEDVENLEQNIDYSKSCTKLLNNEANPILNKSENQIAFAKVDLFKNQECNSLQNIFNNDSCVASNIDVKTNIDMSTSDQTIMNSKKNVIEKNINETAADQNENIVSSDIKMNESDDLISLDFSAKVDGVNGIDFRCNKCSNNIQYPCFTCGKDVQEKTGENERYSCYLASCGRVYHKECLKAWPQATWRGNNSSSKMLRNSISVKEILMCPQHYCHTCISDNPAVQKNKQSNEILVRCIRCPTAYHKRVHCIPAGTEILTMSQIICPRHYEPPGAKQAHFNTSWCFICCIGGSLICCDECPTSFHAECLKLRPEEYEGRYICDDCQTGRYLLYGEVAWVKLGHYRWWPAQILYPNHVPENIQNLPHRRGEFAVKFFGSQNYNWVNRGRAFLYQEGDSGKKNCRKSAVDLTFEKAMEEAEKAYQKLKVDKAARDEEAKMGLKPPRYVRIKTNKPVGNVRIVELNTSNITSCECDPDAEKPCAPDSDCLNRMLLVECNPLVCPAGDRCHNQLFEKRIYPPLMPYKTDRRGWGLKTLLDLKKGDFIIEYVGEMIDEEEYKKRVKIMHKNQEDNYYFLTIDKDRMLDAGPKGNVSRFMNHSCDPNCETQKWTVNGDTRVGLFALKNIPANSELVFNYNLVTQGNEMKPCYCGSEKCSGFIGVKAMKNGTFSNDEEIRKKSNEDNRKRLIDNLHKKNIRHKRKKRARGHIRNTLNCKTVFIGEGQIKKCKNVKLNKRDRGNCFLKRSRNNRFQGRKIEEHFKNSSRNRFSNNMESFIRNRNILKQKILGKRAAVDKQYKCREQKTERRGRKKMPRNEQEKQELLFQMIKRRIERKFEEMSTLCIPDDKCFICGKNEKELLFCDNNKCPRAYHLSCLDRTKWPTGRWLCPWHYCTVCKSIKKVKKCVKCINCYCCLHLQNNIFLEKNVFVCKKHYSGTVLLENEIEKKVLPAEAETEEYINRKQSTHMDEESKLNIVPDQNSSQSNVTFRKRRHILSKHESISSKSEKFSNLSCKNLSQLKNGTVNKNRNVQHYRLGRRKLRQNVKQKKLIKNSKKCQKNVKNKIQLQNNVLAETNIKTNELNSKTDNEKNERKGVINPICQPSKHVESKTTSNESVVSCELDKDNDELKEKKKSNESGKVTDHTLSELTANSMKNERITKNIESCKEKNVSVTNAESSDDEYIINWEVEVINDEESN